MGRSRDDSDYELWAKTKKLNANRKFDSTALSDAGDALKSWWDRWTSATVLKTNFFGPTTNDHVQYRPGSAEGPRLTAMEYKDALDRCLGTLSDERAKDLVVRMVCQGVAAEEIAGERFKSLDRRAAQAIVKTLLCEALADLYPHVMRLQKGTVAEPSQSEAPKKNHAIGR